MALLDIIRDTSIRLGVGNPTVIQSNPDQTVVQMLSLLNEGVEQLMTRYKWPQTIFECNVTANGDEDQGLLTSLAPGYAGMIPQTMWQTDKRLPAVGSISPQLTQTLKGWGSPRVIQNFREVDGHLHFILPAEQGSTFRFEYFSKWFIMSQRTGNWAAAKLFVNDTDYSVFDDEIHKADLKWRFKYEKGFPYAEDFRQFENIADALWVRASADTPKRMDGHRTDARPGIVVPQSNWPVGGQ